MFYGVKEVSLSSNYKMYRAKNFSYMNVIVIGCTVVERSTHKPTIAASNTSPVTGREKTVLCHRAQWLKYRNDVHFFLRRKKIGEKSFFFNFHLIQKKEKTSHFCCCHEMR